MFRPEEPHTVRSAYKNNRFDFSIDGGIIHRDVLVPLPRKAGQYIVVSYWDNRPEFTARDAVVH